MNRKLLKNNLLWGIVMVFFLGAFNDALAQNYTWVGGTSSDFSTFENWNPIPTAFTTSDIFTITATGNNDNQIMNSAAINCRQITLGKGVTFDAVKNITTPSAATTSVNGILNVYTATVNSAKLYVGNSSSAPGIINVNTGGNLAGNNVWRLGVSAAGTININGGTMTLGAAGSLTVGYSSSHAGVINVNSGTLNVNYTSFSSLSINSTGSITIDAGSIVIPGDQTVAVQAFVSANKIKASGAALIAGKPISSRYDYESNTTTVIAGQFLNNSPVAIADSFTVALNGTATVLDGGKTSVLANDTDMERTVLNAVLVSSPSNGTLILNSDGTFSYVHNGSNTTTDSFSYKANDGNSDSNIVNVNITISHISKPSGLSYNTPNTFTRGGYIVPLNPTIGGGAVSFYSVSPSLPTGLGLNSTTGIISGTPRTVSTSNEYTITAANIAGSTTAKVVIAINDHSGSPTSRPMEFLDRGLVALGVNNGVFLSWRMVGSDNPDVGFNLYKNGTKLNTSPITSSTNYVDSSGLVSDLYKVEAILPSGNEMSAEATVWPYAPSIEPGKPNVARLEIPIPAAPGPGYFAGDMSVGDLDGDGKYELVFEWEPTGHPDNAYLEAIDLTGKSLWRISCGPNTTYNGIAFMVYDLDGDGKSEVACVTGPGTKDGLGNFLSKGPAATDDDAMIIPRISGHLMEDPSYVTVFNGLTGAEMATVNYPIPIGPRETHEATWEDNYGKRAQSLKSAVLYDKDKGPLLVFCRGIYSRIAMGAYTWDGNNFKQEWEFDSDKLAEPERTLYRGEGNHGVTVGDVDGDGSDELMYGACAIDNDGKGLYATGRGHGDAHALGDLDPSRPGMEYFQPHENATYGVSFRDAATGEIIWEILSPADVGRAWAADITANNPGLEISVVGDYIDNGKEDESSVFDVKGNPLTYGYSAFLQPVYFDGDIQRELRKDTGIDDVNNGGRLLTAWYYGASTIHSTKQDANLVADILGDWREEIVFVKPDNSAFVLFSSWIPTEHKVYTLMHDPAYRMQVATQNIGYNQPANLSYYLPNGSPKPDIRVIDNTPPAVLVVKRPTTAIAITNATTVIYDVDFSKNVTGVDSNAFTLTATANVTGTITSVVSVSKTSYKVTVSNISGDGTLRLDVKGSGTSILDESNNSLKSGFTTGEIYTFDHTNPTLTAVTVVSNNKKSTLAKVGDTVTLNFTASENITNVITTIAGHSITVTNVSGNDYSATYQLTNTDTEGIVPFLIQFKDVAGNSGSNVSVTTDTKTVTFDRTAPTLSTVTFTSNNVNTAIANEGNVVTLNFTASEAIEIPVVTIAGHSVTVTNVSSNNYTASYIMDGTNVTGIIPFTINVFDLSGNIGNQVIVAAEEVRFQHNAPVIKVYVETPTCPGKANGKINIATDKNGYQYTIKVKGNGVDETLLNQSLSTTSNWERNNLTAGTYQITVGVPSLSFEQTFGVLVNEIAAITAKRVESNKTVSYDVSGSNEYIITVNGVAKNYTATTIETSKVEIDANLLQEVNTVTIATNNDCQKTIEDNFTINPIINVHPNPTSDVVYIEGVSKGLIQVYTNSGTLLMESNAENEKSINLKGYAAGIYLVTITQETEVETFKVILK